MNRFQCLLFCAFLFSSCSSDPGTYTVETIDGVRHVHNRAPLWGDTPKVKLEFVRKYDRYEFNGEECRPFDFMDVAVDRDGNRFIVDHENSRIAVFGENGETRRVIDLRGNGSNSWTMPQSIDIDTDGNIYVAEFSKDRIRVLDPHGKYLTEIPAEPRPRFVALLSDGGIVVPTIESNLNMVIVPEGPVEEEYKLLSILNREGETLRQFGELEMFDSYDLAFAFNSITYCVDDMDNIFCAFMWRNKIEKYRPDGMLLFSSDRTLNYNEPAPEGEGFLISAGIGVDARSRIWVLTAYRQPDFDDPEDDKQFFLFEVFDETGILLGTLPLPLPEHRNCILTEVSGNSLFVTKSHIDAAVYEYRIVDLE